MINNFLKDSFKDKKTKWLVVSLLFIIVFLVLLYLLVLRHQRITNIYSDYDSGSDQGESFTDPSCNVAGINIHGELKTYTTLDEENYDFASSENILSSLWDAESAENIKAIIVEVDSYGGSPVASQEIADAIRKIEKPVIALVRGAAASGGYWIASSADRIFASDMSDIGGIGVSMSYIDYSKSNQEQGITWNSLSTGKFKDSGSEDKPLTYEEKMIFQRDLNIIHKKFVEAVAQNRGLSIEKVSSLADGSTMLGEAAIQEGLIDEIGFIDEVESYIKESQKIEPVICF